jgi:hypothetical protein
VTAWGAHAVEFFKVLADTQYMNHIRPDNDYAPNLRHWRPGEYMNTGFDATAHTVDVRRIAVQRGRYNIQNIGIFLWSLNAYSLTMTPATPVAKNPQCFRFSSLGRDMPLFNNPISQGADITDLAQPMNVPDRLRRRVLCHDLQQIFKKQPAVYYGIGKSLALYLSNSGSSLPPTFVQPLPVSGDPTQPGICICDLSGKDGIWANLPVAGGPIAIDPHLGRIALPPPPAGSNPPQVQASFYYGFNGDMGGGEYPRLETFAASPEQAVVRVPQDFSTVQQAVNALSGKGVVEIADSGMYWEPKGLTVTVDSNDTIELRAADGCRPTLNLGGAITVNGGADSAFYLNGLVVTYALQPGSPPPGGPLPPALLYAPSAGSNQLGILALTHCTLVPGWALTPQGAPQPAYVGLPTLLAETPGLQVVIEKSILGGLAVSKLATANVSDSIVDATDSAGAAYVAPTDPILPQPQPGGPLTLQGCTVVGTVYASLLTLVSDSIVWASLSSTPPLWNGPLWASRKQEGCVRFSYLPAGSVTPRTFQCVEQGSRSPQPLFVSMRYGDPGYLKLFASTDDAIRRGADDGGELGAYHFLLAPLRETNLRVRMQEYLPAGLEFGIIYET